ncbi:MAG: hypothetical protein GY799_14925 [Desulfobulbaceae bacterium]|nr:hypothetical protein [Desulfobulbaceae bacterium]
MANFAAFFPFVVRWLFEAKLSLFSNGAGKTTTMRAISRLKNQERVH